MTTVDLTERVDLTVDDVMGPMREDPSREVAFLITGDQILALYEKFRQQVREVVA